MQTFLEESVPHLQAMSGNSVMSEECRHDVTSDVIDSSYFYIGTRANAKLNPMRMLVDGREMAIPADELKRDVLRAVCVLGQGFFARDLPKLVPNANARMINEVLISLVRVGFLDFINSGSDLGGSPGSSD
jgi:hypothetical protein